MVIVLFWLAVMVLTLIALALLLPPLLRAPTANGADRRAIERELATLKRRHGAGEIDQAAYNTQRTALTEALVTAVETSAPANAPRLAVVLALALPIAALALYFGKGRPDALDTPVTTTATTADGGSPQDMDAAIASLEARLREHPDEVNGWLLLARSYRALERFDDMLRATSSAYALAPAVPDVLAEHAEAKALSSPSRRFEGETRALLEQALAADGVHQKALWLLGVAELQAQNFPQAVAYWQRLRALVPPDDPVGATLDQQIAAAQARIAGVSAEPTAAPPAAGPTTTDDTGAGPKLHVTIDLAPALRARLRSEDTLFVFVFVRAPGGGPPLAIRRITAAQFPIDLHLTQADRMLPGVQMEIGAEVSVGARLSKSGQAQAQAGDLQATPATLTLAADNTTALHINQIVE